MLNKKHSCIEMFKIAMMTIVIKNEPCVGTQNIGTNTEGNSNIIMSKYVIALYLMIFAIALHVKFIVLPRY